MSARNPWEWPTLAFYWKGEWLWPGGEMTRYSWARVKQRKVPRGLWTGAPAQPCSVSHAGPGSKIGAGWELCPGEQFRKPAETSLHGVATFLTRSQLITKRMACGLWAAPSNAASPWKRIRTQAVVLWSPVHAHSIWCLWLPTPHSLSSRITSGPVSHLHTHCLGEQPVPPMSSRAKTAKHLQSTALSKGGIQCAVDPIGARKMTREGPRKQNHTERQRVMNVTQKNNRR